MTLKPCPCCGGGAFRQPANRHGNTCVTCRECGLSTRWGPPEVVVEMWNRRISIFRWRNAKTDPPPWGIDVIISRQGRTPYTRCMDIAHIKSGQWRSASDGRILKNVTHWTPLPEEMP